MATPSVTYQRSDSRYYVSIDGDQVGWVSKSSLDGTWRMWATVNESIQGQVLASGCKTRRDAVLDGIGSLRIWHLGLIHRLNLDTYKDERFVFPEATLRAVEELLLDQKYPVA